MGISKKNSKIKEPVRLRAKKLVNGNRSLYLDTYHEGKRSYEFLKLYLVRPANSADRKANAATLRAANAIKASRILALINGKADIRTECGDMTVSDWIRHIIASKTGKRSKSSIMLMRRLEKHLQLHRPGARLRDVDRCFCIGFAIYLRSAQALNSAKPLGPATQYEIFNALSLVLNEAVRGELISKNPMRLLNASERIKKTESIRDYLTTDEVRRLIRVARRNIEAADDIAAFLFCCFCGLRYSDASALRWGNIRETDGGKEIFITMKKTLRPVTVPLSRQACALLPPRGKSEEKIFNFPSYYTTLLRLKKAAVAAGIGKKLTFHVSRHTFATLMLTAGADLYTISKLIGHSDVRTTQIYSKVIDSKKRETVALLDKLYDDQ